MLRVVSESPARQKSTFAVWGANHNFYNTEWQLSDSAGCLGHKRLFDRLLGSPDERSTALASVLAFFRAHVAATLADTAFAEIFNPQFELPAGLEDITRIDRGYTDSADASVTTTFDDFDGPTGFSSYGVPNTASNVMVAHGGIANHSSLQRVVQIAWKAPGTDTFFQSNWTGAGSGRSASTFKTLDFRVARQCGDALCTKTDSHWLFATSFSVGPVSVKRTLSTAIPISNYLTLTCPVGGLVRGVGTSPHPILQTIRIPLSAFGSAAIVTNLRGVRFTFDDTKSDEIFIGNIRLSSVSGLNAATLLKPEALAGDDSVVDDSTTKTDNNQIKAIRQASSVSGTSDVEIELTSNRDFLPESELLVLRIGGAEFTASRYSETGDTGTVIFTLSTVEFSQLEDGSPVTVQYGLGHDDPNWRFGRLNKGQLAK